MNKTEHARLIAKIKERIAEEVEKNLEERKGASPDDMEHMTDKVFAAGLTKAISIINEVEAEAEVKK